MLFEWFLKKWAKSVVFLSKFLFLKDLGVTSIDLGILKSLEDLKPSLATYIEDLSKI